MMAGFLAPHCYENDKGRVVFKVLFHWGRIPAFINQRSMQHWDLVKMVSFRKWYRPAAPMIADEALEAVFGRKILSRYMERAPKATLGVNTLRGL